MTGQPPPFTPGIDLSLTLENADVHRFGLTQSRWSWLRDKVFWITGGGTGYGFAFANALSCAGAKVVLSSRNSQKLEAAKATIEARIPRADITTAPLDLADQNSIESSVASTDIDQAHGVIHSAAVPQFSSSDRSPLLSANYAAWDNMMAVNVRGPYVLSVALLEHFRRAKTGRIIFCSSMAGWSSTRGFGPYNTSKAALANLAVSFGTELAEAMPDFDFQTSTLILGEARSEMNKGSTVDPIIAAPMALRLATQAPNSLTGQAFLFNGLHVPVGMVPPHNRALDP